MPAGSVSSVYSVSPAAGGMSSAASAAAVSVLSEAPLRTCGRRRLAAATAASNANGVAVGGGCGAAAVARPASRHSGASISCPSANVVQPGRSAVSGILLNECQLNALSNLRSSGGTSRCSTPVASGVAAGAVPSALGNNGVAVAVGAGTSTFVGGAAEACARGDVSAADSVDGSAVPPPPPPPAEASETGGSSVGGGGYGSYASSAAFSVGSFGGGGAAPQYFPLWEMQQRQLLQQKHNQQQQLSQQQQRPPGQQQGQGLQENEHDEQRRDGQSPGGSKGTVQPQANAASSGPSSHGCRHDESKEPEDSAAAAVEAHCVVADVATDVAGDGAVPHANVEEALEQQLRRQRRLVRENQERHARELRFREAEYEEWVDDFGRDIDEARRMAAKSLAKLSAAVAAEFVQGLRRHEAIHEAQAADDARQRKVELDVRVQKLASLRQSLARLRGCGDGNVIGGAASTSGTAHQ
eukprot:TRINITY_DN56560_c0_g1_i1.p1 TRINITY_DN56560_c0_g1~~TRINITY_DN56560_c0_g1_i1.p1  ORF type:complete len:479 (+),score=110.63 TRINITY_DN56560_c0_g1_i1:31-1437(+)